MVDDQVGAGLWAAAALRALTPSLSSEQALRHVGLIEEEPRTCQCAGPGYLVNSGRCADGYVPVPDRLTVCGLAPPSSLTDKLAWRLPFAAGLKVTLMVQLPPAVTALPQLLD